MKAWGNKNIIRREELGDVEPWRMGQFNGPSVQRPHHNPPPPPAPAPVVPIVAPAEPSREPVFPSQAEIDAELAAARQAAHDEGYAAGRAAGHTAGHAAGMAAGREAGHAEGRDAGMNEGYQAGLQQGRNDANAEITRFRTVIDNLDQAVTDFEARMTEPILDLALLIARQVIGTTLENDPARMLGPVREALGQLPDLQGPLKIVVNPDDAEIIAQLKAEPELAHSRIVIDAALARGGCRLETPQVDFDLSLETRWRRVIATLGRHDPLGPPLPPPEARVQVLPPAVEVEPPVTVVEPEPSFDAVPALEAPVVAEPSFEVVPTWEAPVVAEPSFDVMPALEAPVIEVSEPVIDLDPEAPR